MSWVFTALERDLDAEENTYRTAITAIITILSINFSAIVQYHLSNGLSVVDQLVVLMVSFRIGPLYLSTNFKFPSYQLFCHLGSQWRHSWYVL